MTATRPIADHPSCARPNGRDHRTALTANQTIPAAEVGIDDPAMTAYWLDSTAWHFLDGQIDVVLTNLRASHPDSTTEANSLNALLQSLS